MVSYDLCFANFYGRVECNPFQMENVWIEKIESLSFLKAPKPNPQLGKMIFKLKFGRSFLMLQRKTHLPSMTLSLRSLVFANSPWWCNQTHWNPFTNQWIAGIRGFWTTGFTASRFLTAPSMFVDVYGLFRHVHGIFCPPFLLEKKGKTMLFWWWPCVLQLSLVNHTSFKQKRRKYVQKKTRKTMYIKFWKETPQTSTNYIKVSKQTPKNLQNKDNYRVSKETCQKHPKTI